MSTGVALRLWSWNLSVGCIALRPESRHQSSKTPEVTLRSETTEPCPSKLECTEWWQVEARLLFGLLPWRKVVRKCTKACSCEVVASSTRTVGQQADVIPYGMGIGTGVLSRMVEEGAGRRSSLGKTSALPLGAFTPMSLPKSIFPAVYALVSSVAKVYNCSLPSPTETLSGQDILEKNTSLFCFRKILCEICVQPIN